MALLGRPLRKTETKSGFHREGKEFSLLMLFCWHLKSYTKIVRECEHSTQRTAW